jgi:uncharacterized protein (TIGR03435 family)
MADRCKVLAGLLALSACYAQTPARPEFEAASVKPSVLPDGGATYMFCRGGPGTADPGLFRCENFSLANLMNRAYELGPNQLSAPDWIGAARFDIDAKVPPGTTPPQFGAMLRNLLADRFKLAVHQEKREAREYRLVTAKDGPKFQPAARQQPDTPGDAAQEPSAAKALPFDQAGYPTFKPGESGTRSTFNGRTRMQEPRMSMPRLAAILSGYFHANVADATGLKGDYAIGLFWILDSAPSAGPADDAPGPTLIQALQKELGLRVEKTAGGTTDVLVIDHAEKAPAGN